VKDVEHLGDHLVVRGDDVVEVALHQHPPCLAALDPTRLLLVGLLITTRAYTPEMETLTEQEGVARFPGPQVGYAAFLDVGD
jgi:hypothetical protein